MTKRLKRSLILSVLYTVIVVVLLFPIAVFAYDSTVAKALEWVALIAPVQFIGVFLLNYFDFQKNADVEK